MQAAVLTVQAGWRMYKARVAYLRIRRGALLMQVRMTSRGRAFLFAASGRLTTPMNSPRAF